MKKRNEDNPDNLGGHGEMLPADVLNLVNELLERLQQTNNTNYGSFVFTYVAPEAQNIQHLDSQIINQGIQNDSLLVRQAKDTKSKDLTPSKPPQEVMVRAVEKTISEGLWSTSTCWSVVYVVYRIHGYDGSISDFVREVESWKFTKTVKYKCNRDSVGKPLRNKKMTYNLDNWLNDGVQKPFFILALALMEEINKEVPPFHPNILNIP